MKKMILLFVLIFFTMSGCAKNQSANIENEILSESITNIDQSELINVKVETVKKHLFKNTLQMSGEITPFKEIMITARIGGEIKLLNVDVGEIVKKNQIIGTQNDRMLGLIRQKALIGLKSAEINLNDAKKQYDKNKTLLKENAVSQTIAETYAKTYELSKIGLELAKNDYATADENYRYTIIKSPIDGIISSKNVSVGENINAGARIFTIVDTNQVYVDVGVSEINVNKLLIGMSVKISVNVNPGIIYEGKITNIGPVPNETNMYPVKILIQNTEKTIKSGMFASVQTELGNQVEGIAIPKYAVQNDEARNYIMIIDDKKAKRIDVKLGLEDEQYYEIKEGIKEGVQIIISGQNIVKDGDLINIQN